MNTAPELRHPLPHDGTSRRRRMIEALLPEYVPVDGRDSAALLSYAREYARLLRFEDPAGYPAGDWRSLIEGDASVLAALMLHAETAHQAQQRFMAQLESFEQQAGQPGAAIPLAEALQQLLRMALELLDWRAKAAPELSLAQQLEQLIPSVAGDAFCRLLLYLRRAEELGVLASGLPLERYEAEWPLQDPPRGFAPLAGGLPADADAAFQEAFALRLVFRKLNDTRAPLLAGAPRYLEETLEKYPQHEPHMALFLAFVQLMGILRQEMNGLSKKHLDFYYREVLRLDNQPAVPDQAHMVMELAQGFVNGLIEKADRFLDGKDSLGQDILFAPNEELVVSPATLHPEQGLKTLFIEKGDISPAGDSYEVLNAYAAPDADAGARKSDDGKWMALGNTNDPAARFGFAIASPMFLLGEGEREIVLRFRMEGFEKTVEKYGLSRLKSELRNNVKVFVSGEKAWIELHDKSVDIETGPGLQLLPDESAALEIGVLEYRLRLSSEMPAIVPYHEKLPGQEPVPDKLDAQHPVACFVFNNFGLSTLGNIELNLAAGVKAFDANQQYLPGELVRFPGAGTEALYKSNAVVIGISPDQNLEIWQDITAAILAANAYNNGSAYAVGAFVTHLGKSWRANGGFASAHLPQPGSTTKIWEPLTQSQGTFDPEKPYSANDLVSDGGQIYRAIGNVAPIAPNVNPTAWDAIQTYSPGNPPVPAGGFPKNTFFRYNGKLYSLQTENASFGPDLNADVWTPLIVKSAQPGQVYLSGEYAQDLSSLYQLNAANNRLTDAPPGNSNIWQQIPAYNAGNNSFPVNTEVYRNTQVYRANFGLGRVSLGSYNNNTPLLPERQFRIWENVPAYVSGNAYEEGNFVLDTAGNITTFYYKTGASNTQPLTHTASWHALGTWNNSTNALTGKARGDWTSLLTFQFADVVRIAGAYYAATVSLPAGINPLDPNQNRLLWAELSGGAVPPYDAATDFTAGSYAQQTGTCYKSNFRNLNIAPTLSGVWQHILFISANSYTAATYPPNQLFVKDQIIRFDNAFYSAATPNRGIPPSLAAQAWKELASVTAYDPLTPYAQNNAVSWKGNFYYAKTAITRFAPASSSEWQAGAQIGEYDAQKAYAVNDLASLGNSFFYAQAATQGLHPSLNLPAWEEAPAAGNMLPYNPLNTYSAGAYTAHNGSKWRSIAGSTGIAPGGGALVWQNQVAIKPFNPATAYAAGDFVVFNGQYYRSLFGFTGNYTPLNAPELWQLAGVIRDYNPAMEWYAYMLVRAGSGRIYMAKQFVPAGQAPEGNPDASDYWEEVVYAYPYRYFFDAGLSRLDMEVSVSGMRNLLLENDQGVIDPAKPFMPFGSQPVRGSQFYIGNHEVFYKSPNRIELTVEWGNLPLFNGNLSFASHYLNYKAGNTQLGPPNNAYFSFAPLLLNRNVWTGAIQADNNKLFEAAGSTQTPNPISFTFNISPADFPRDPALPVFRQLSAALKRGFMAFELEKDFLHDEYPVVLAKVAMTNPPVPADIPLPPYTPLINALTLSYSANETLVFKDKTPGDLAQRVERFYHLHPYGWAEFVPVENELDEGRGPVASRELVARYYAQAGNSEGELLRDENLGPVLRDAAGNLLIGVRDLRPPQLLTLLCQVAEGSENPARDKRYVSWSYLSDNRWRFFETGQIVADDSNGLLRPGIVKLNVPSDAGAANTLLPAGMFWLRAAVSEYPDGVGQLYDLRLHAVKATFENNQNELGRLNKPLPAGSLSKLFFRKAAINKVEQPFDTFGGSVEEQDADFYLRVSERLRHKGRAVSLYDYERIVLAQFPQVYQVKCITHAEALADAMPLPPHTWDELIHTQLQDGIEHRPGMVQVVVLPDLRNQNAIDPLRPRVSNNLRDEIQRYLKRRCSGFADVQVENPIFEEVIVKGRVALKAGKDPGFYLKQLEEDLIRYLSPWRFDTDYDLHFGDCLHISPIIDYIDELGYVDYVEQLSLNAGIRDENGVLHSLESGVESLCAHTEASVLISAARHAITLIETHARC